MQMPRDIVVDSADESTVKFSTPSGVSGTAFLKRGYNETSYEIVDAFAIPEDKEQLVQVDAIPGELDVIGCVDLVFDGGESISVKSHGFTFFVDSTEHRGPLGTVGTWVQLRVRGFTLWIGETL
jgi:hypothetical protein